MQCSNACVTTRRSDHLRPNSLAHRHAPRWGDHTQIAIQTKRLGITCVRKAWLSDAEPLAAFYNRVLALPKAPSAQHPLACPRGDPVAVMDGTFRVIDGRLIADLDYYGPHRGTGLFGHGLWACIARAPGWPLVLVLATVREQAVAMMQHRLTSGAFLSVHEATLTVDGGIRILSPGRMDRRPALDIKEAETLVRPAKDLRANSPLGEGVSFVRFLRACLGEVAADVRLRALRGEREMSFGLLLTADWPQRYA